MGVRLLVGTAKGGFRVTSDDRREWEVSGPFFKGWKVTTAGCGRYGRCARTGGLCCHAFLFDHNDPNRMWCGISAVGVFRTDDGGATWVPKNRGVYWAHEDEEFKEIGHCVHGLAQDPDVPERIYRQDHSGMYRSDDGAETWKRTRWLEGWDAPVSEGDTVVFMQAVSGG